MEPLELLDLLTRRSTVVALALLGAGVAIAGSLLRASRPDTAGRLATAVIRIGYGVTWLSVALFIVAGFRAS